MATYDPTPKAKPIPPRPRHMPNAAHFDEAAREGSNALEGGSELVREVEEQASSSETEEVKRGMCGCVVG